MLAGRDRCVRDGFRFTAREDAFLLRVWPGTQQQLTATASRNRFTDRHIRLYDTFLLVYGRPRDVRTATTRPRTSVRSHVRHTCSPKSDQDRVRWFPYDDSTAACIITVRCYYGACIITAVVVSLPLRALAVMNFPEPVASRTGLGRGCTLLS